MLRVALFDLDGTLIDSIALILDSLAHTLEVHRGEAPPPEFFRRGLGIPLKEQFRHFTEDPREVDAMIATYRRYNAIHHDQSVRAFPGVVETLTTLHDDGIVMAVVTNKLGAVAARGLAVCGLESHVEVVIAVEDVTFHKPDPEPVRAALDRLGRGADEAILVGDSPLDLRAGRAAGVRTAAALWGPFGSGPLAPHAPDYWLDSPEDLVEIFTP